MDKIQGILMESTDLWAVHDAKGELVIIAPDEKSAKNGAAAYFFCFGNGLVQSGQLEKTWALLNSLGNTCHQISICSTQIDRQQRERVEKLKGALTWIRRDKIGTYYEKPISPIGIRQTYKCSDCEDKVRIAKAALKELEATDGH